MPDMAHVRFNLVYDGPALAQHQMDVRDLAPALLAMGDLFDRANEMFNGTQTKVSVNVNASFKSGSFGIDLDLAQTLWQRVLDLAGNRTVVDIEHLAELLGIVVGAGKGVIETVRWLRGRGVRRIEPLENGNVRLWVDDEQLDIEERVYTLLHDYRIRKNLESLIAQPLAKEGIDEFATTDKDAKRVMVRVERADAHYFIAPPIEEEPADETEYEARLQVLTLAFKDDNKWRFTDGSNAFYAPILDDDFLRRIATNEEAFSKDDLLRARIRRTQRITAEGLKAEYAVLKVLDHTHASPKVQLRINLPPEPPST